jgi:aldehyde dehydrogenase (NAD+)
MGPAQMAAFATCSHAGQGCAIPTRMVVPRARVDVVAATVAGLMGGVSYGDPADPAVYMGPLISERQRDKVDGLVQRAVEAGATLVTGGTKVSPGYFYTPTVLSNVDPDSEIAQEEVFGPVLAIIPHDGDDDAVRIANNSIYGLSGAVFSGSDDRALAVARRIRTGTMSVNGGAWFGADAPFGGYKQSGIGKEMGKAGLEEFLEAKTLAAVIA